MVYILLDTNIIIDIVVDRKNNVSDSMLKSFVKLLDYGEITLIVPDIIITETTRHLDEEIDIVGKNIDSVMDRIKGLYGIRSYKIESLDLSEYKKNSRAELNKAQQLFRQNKENYREDIHHTIDLMFNHRNTIQIDDECIMSKVQKRRVHKMAPFHKEAKESYGDGVIVESLVNIKKFADVDTKDQIYFVTGNYKDFSASDNKDNLHPDIIKSLEEQKLDTQVVYVTSFNRLITQNLKDCVERADLIEEFEAEMREEEENHYQSLEEDLRESAGLTALSSFVSMVDDYISESPLIEGILELFERINKSYRKLEDLYWYFEDEFKIDEIDCADVVSRLHEIAECENKPTVINLRNILEWIDLQKRECSEIEQFLPDDIIPGNEIIFWDVNRKKYALLIESLDNLSPCSGDADTLDVRLVGIEENTVVSTGTIDITYGFIKEDQFDGIGDGCQESIDINIEDITSVIKRICTEWEDFVSEKEILVEKIQNKMEIN